MTYPSGKPNVGDETRDITGSQIDQAQEGHEEHCWGWGHAFDLDHGQDLWHLTFHGTSIEEPRVEGQLLETIQHHVV